MGLIAFLIMGLIAGFIARWLMPGPDPMGWVSTMVVGIVGSFVGGTIAALIFGGTLEISAAGLIGSILGALIVLWAWRQFRGRSATA
jgi:uncharacterized membrane protein YeaQ/YmgE (transglycosylase-associated protein family)